MCMNKIVFTGGGTLGHVMPNIYLIEELKDCSISYIGSIGIEKQKILENNIKFYEIPSVKLQRGKIFANFKIPFVLISAINKATKVLKEVKPDVVFSKGGYVSLPVCLAARKLKIPIISHESDYSFGLANKIILKLCNTMCVNFKNLENYNKKIVYTGPIFSSGFENKNKNKQGLNLDENKPTILIVCGSLGSKKINETLLNIVYDLEKSFNIIHLVGKGNIKVNSFKNYNVFETRNDMVNLYNIADFVIGRAGAGVTAECYFKNLPMLLIPLQNKASRGDQVLNAEYYKDLGVAEIIKEDDLSSNKLNKEIENFYKKINNYKENYKKTQKINGKTKILELINKYLK